MSDEKTDVEVNHLIAERRAKLERLRERGGAFPNDYRRDSTAEQLHLAYGVHPAEWFEAHPTRVTIAGRMMFKRVMGKASFVKLKDRSGLMQVFLQQDPLGTAYDDFKGWDVGDILGAEGTLFKTKTGELTVKAQRVRLLVKSLRPLPDKWHGARGRREPLSATLRGPDRERREPRGLSAPHADHPVPPELPRGARLHGGRDADDAGDPGRSYVVPARAAGKWQSLVNAGGRATPMEFDLQQLFQEIEGKVEIRDRGSDLRGRILGDRIRLLAGGRGGVPRHTGQIADGTITGTLAIGEGASRQQVAWTARQIQRGELKRASDEPRF